MKIKRRFIGEPLCTAADALFRPHQCMEAEKDMTRKWKNKKCKRFQHFDRQDPTPVDPMYIHKM